MRPRAALAMLERESGVRRAGPRRHAALAGRTAACTTRSRSSRTDDAELRFKHELPNYGVFDEKRVFAPGPLPEPVTFRDVRIGLPICEDIWFPTCHRRISRASAPSCCSSRTARRSRSRSSSSASSSRARASPKRALPLAYVNQVGGQDELVFDGGSFVMNARRHRSRSCCPSGANRSSLTRWTRDGNMLPLRGRRGRGRRTAAPRCDLQRDDARPARLRPQERFPGVVLGMSGGIDSALTAAVAVDALGAARVRGVRLPSRFTSDAEPGRRGGIGAAARHAARHAADRGAGRSGRKRAGAGLRRPRRAMSPKRTCRRASAACC